MPTVQEITQRIAAANAEVKRLNNERNVNLGKRETLTAQLNNTLAKYSQQYGVALTVDNLQKEMQRVLQEKENETTLIENMLALIKEGKYEDAERLANPDAFVESNTEPTPTVEPTPVAPTPTAEPTSVEPTPVAPTPTIEPTPVAPTPTVEPTPVAPTPTVEPTPVAPTPTVEPTPVSPLPNLSEEVMPEPKAPVLPNLSEEIKMPEPVAPSKTVLPDLSEEVGMDALKGFQSGEPAPITPTAPKSVVDTSTLPDLTGVTDFEAILGGEAFKA